MDHRLRRKEKMNKRILKKTFPIQYLYAGNTDYYQFMEDYYTIYEGQIDGTQVCFYSRNKSVIKKTSDGGITYTENVEFENPSFFIAVGYNFADIQSQIVTSDDGRLEWVSVS